jgi:heme/copper-type cytochrome/quinol oxidase subunit 3
MKMRRFHLLPRSSEEIKEASNRRTDRQAVTKDLTSSSKFSGSFVLTLQTLPYSCFFIFFSLFSFILAWTFISLQIKEFRIMGLSINDSVYSCLFFFLTGLHFFHLLVGLFLCCLFFYNCSFSSEFTVKTSPMKKKREVQRMVKEM